MNWKALVWLSIALSCVALPASAQSNDLTHMYCASAYIQVSHSQRAPTIIAEYAKISAQGRDKAVMSAHGVLPDVSLAYSKTYPSIQDALDSGDRALQEEAVRSLAGCDDIYKFTPVYALK